MSTVLTGQDTGARLLTAAMEVFCEVGYREATLRTICQRAGTNNAAVNYHFRDKEHLYLAVLDLAIQEWRERRKRAEGEPSAPPEERLRKFVHSLLTDLLGGDSPTWLMKLVAHELAEPTAGLDYFIAEGIRPFNAEIAAIVREIVGPEASDQTVQDCVISLVAQCHHYHHGRAVVARMKIYEKFDKATIDHLADHIIRFSLAGMRAVAGR